MVLFNHSTRELTAKIVYYGAGLCGKTTNLKLLHERLEKGTAGRLLSLATAQDRTIYFDLLPVELGNIKGYTVRFQLCTVPGQVYYNETRKLVLRGVDGIVFVVDSQWSMLSHNLESFQNLRENLADADVAFDALPLVVQYNKRDLAGVLSVDALQESLGFQSYPYVEAIASAGKGVVETFKLVSKLTFVDLLRRLQRIPGPETERTEGPESGEETVVQTTRRKPSSFIEPARGASSPELSAAGGPNGPISSAAPPATPPPAPAPSPRPSPRPSPDDSWRRLFARAEQSAARSAANAPTHVHLPTVAEPFELGSAWKAEPDTEEVFGAPAAPPITEPTTREEDVFAPDLSATIAIASPLAGRRDDGATTEVTPLAAPASESAAAPEERAAEDRREEESSAEPGVLALQAEVRTEVERLSSELASLREALASDLGDTRDRVEADVAGIRAALASELAALREEDEEVRRRLLSAQGQLAARALPREDLDALRQESERTTSALREELASLAGSLRQELATLREEQRAESRRLEDALAGARGELGSLRAELEGRTRTLGEVVESSHGKLVEEIASARQDARRELERAEAELARLDSSLGESRRHADERVARLVSSFRRAFEEQGPGD
ncbi:MAG TPA: ADP-ribosylation factor-like protein [Thermoanaerobaculia bacterium]|nr:ADP-ribosylation factor-like protein [Thermoanaerobaculia bacterium]